MGRVESTDGRRVRPQAVLFALIAILSVARCATQPEAMVPDVATFTVPQEAGPPARTLRVTPGTATTPTVWQQLNRSMMDPAVFQAALITTLTRSQLFERVVTEGPADYELEARINGYKIKPGLPPTFVFFVTYRLKDVAAGRDVWDGDIVSTGEMPYAPGLRPNRDAPAAQDNLAKLIVALSKVPSLRIHTTRLRQR